MAKSLLTRIKEMQGQILLLNSKIQYLESKLPGSDDSGNLTQVPLIPLGNVGNEFPSTDTGLGRIYGSQPGIIWNDAEAELPPFGTQPGTPTKGYQKHSHSKYAGGALDLNTLEIVKYKTGDAEEDIEIIDSDGNILNRHTQSFWKSLAQIEVDDNNKEKIATIADNLVWDKDANDGNGAWRFYAVYKDEDEEEEE